VRAHDDQFAAELAGQLDDDLGRLADVDVLGVGQPARRQPRPRPGQRGLALLAVMRMQRFLADMGLDAADRDRRVDVQQVDFGRCGEPRRVGNQVIDGAQRAGRAVDRNRSSSSFPYIQPSSRIRRGRP
jgi:hypothetical protein